MENFQVYRDIQARTGGDIYIGVVGPVRTGKSTFIRRFMELVALPALSEGKRAELQDELPLSGAGKMITTVEPKFIPKETVEVSIGENQKIRVKLIDCVGVFGKGCIRKCGRRQGTDGQNTMAGKSNPRFMMRPGSGRKK